MKKALVAALALGAASAGLWLAPATAANDCPAQDLDPSDNSVSVQTPLGGICASGDATTQTGHLWIDGEDSNPGPASGYVAASNDGQGIQGVCADDHGGPASGSTSPTCAPQP
ncbi:MAG: hypothetical protein HYU28_07405 [Actinobacteria bacterium]|nr:hypothetical protein [Actinomycetota bacterium]